MLQQVEWSIMYIIATVDHRGLYNAVCKDSADWANSAWALTITKHAEFPPQTRKKEVKIIKDAENQNVEAGRQVM